jgi:hypothetical protein
MASSTISFFVGSQISADADWAAMCQMGASKHESATTRKILKATSQGID